MILTASYSVKPPRRDHMSVVSVLSAVISKVVDVR